VTDPRDSTPGIEAAIGHRVEAMVRALVQGNLHRASRTAKRLREEEALVGRNIALGNLVESTALVQAMKIGLLNLPSTLPGPGTVIAWILMGVEDFYNLDGIVSLVTAIALFAGHDAHDVEGLEELALSIVGRVYGIEDAGSDGSRKRTAWRLFSRLVPRQYAVKGVNRWVKGFLRRLLRLRRKSRLLPMGLGVAASAWDAYNLVVKAGMLAQAEATRMARVGARS